MQITLRQYEYKKIEATAKDFVLPTEPAYFFETGIRRSIRIIPVYTSWNMEQFNKEEELYRFDVTLVYLSFECKIEKFGIQVSDLERAYHDPKHKLHSIVYSWVEGYLNNRTQSQFETDLVNAINRINE